MTQLHPLHSGRHGCCICGLGPAQSPESRPETATLLCFSRGPGIWPLLGHQEAAPLILSAVRAVHFLTPVNWTHHINVVPCIRSLASSRGWREAHLLLIPANEGAALWQEEHATLCLFGIQRQTLACGKVDFLITYRCHLAHCNPGDRGFPRPRRCHAAQSRSVVLAGRSVYIVPRWPKFSTSPCSVVSRRTHIGQVSEMMGIRACLWTYSGSSQCYRSSSKHRKD